MKIKIIPSTNEGLAIIAKHVPKRTFFHYHEKNGKTGIKSYQICKKDMPRGEDSTFAIVSDDMTVITVYSNEIPNWIKQIALGIEKVISSEVLVILNKLS